jgi:hypothetical protein
MQMNYRFIGFQNQYLVSRIGQCFGDFKNNDTILIVNAPEYFKTNFSGGLPKFINIYSGGKNLNIIWDDVKNKKINKKNIIGYMKFENFENVESLVFTEINCYKTNTFDGKF